MGQSSSWGSNSHSFNEEIPLLLWNPKTPYRVHRSVPLAPVLRQCIQSTPLHPISLRFVLILSFHLHLGLPNGFFPSSILTKIIILCEASWDNVMTLWIINYKYFIQRWVIHFSRKTSGEDRNGTASSRWGDVTKMNVTEIKCEAVQWIELAQDRAQ
jgi:hypothetical protein